MNFADVTSPNSQMAARYIPEDVKRQLLAAQLLQKTATDASQPIYSNTLGLAKMGAAGIGGILEGMTEKREAAAQADYLKDLKDAGGINSSGGATAAPSGGLGIGAMLAKLLTGGGSDTPAPEPAKAASFTPAELAAGLENKPLSSITPQDRDAYIRTVATEDNSPEGRAAVAAVIRNRTLTGRWGDTPGAVVQAKGQFEPWMNGRAQALAPNSADYKAAAAIVDQTLAGAPDPTKGATHFYGPEAQAALGRQPPSWAQGEGVRIGGNAFYAPEGRVNVAQAQPFAQDQTAAAPQASPQAAVPGQPGNPPAPDTQRRIQALQNIAGNPRATPQERLWALQQLQPDMEIKEGKDGSLWALDKRNPGAGLRPIGQLPTEKWRATKTPEGADAQQSSFSGEYKSVPQKETAISEVEYAQKNWKSLGFPDPGSTEPKDMQFWRDYNAKRLGGSGTAVTIDQRGENEFAKKGGGQLGEDFAGIVKVGRMARQNISDIQTLGVLLNAVETGKMAEAKAIIGPYAQALGIDVKGLSEIQAADAIINRMAPQMRVPGSGAQSDFELRNFMKQMPSIGATPEGNVIIQKTLSGMYQNQVRAAEIASDALAGKITPREADRQMRELPDHMASYRDFMKSKGDGQQNSSGWQEISPGVRIRQK